MIYKYTKCEPVIAKIMADSDMSERNVKITDIREWIFEAIEKIGAPMLYIERESGIDGCPVIKVEDYLAAIPEDLIHLTSVAYSDKEKGPWQVVRKTLEQFKSLSRLKFGRVRIDPSKEEIIFKSQKSHWEAKNRSGIYDTLKYFIKPGWIVLNKKDGYLKLEYKAVPTDERGYPLIPDTTSYQEAIYWYVMMKLTFPQWLKGSYSTKRAATGAQYAYTYIQQQWNFYRNLAYAEAMMPTESDMISIKNEWNKLVPEYESDQIFFHNSGEEQLNYNDYYYGY